MRFALATLGCKVNHYDSAIIESRLAARGLERRDFGEAVDVYVINTCTVTDRADSECLKLARRAKRRNPKAKVVMTGCFAQANPHALAGRREVDAVVGLGRLDDLERAVIAETGARVRAQRKESARLHEHRPPRFSRQPRRELPEPILELSLAEGMVWSGGEAADTALRLLDRRNDPEVRGQVIPFASAK